MPNLSVALQSVEDLSRWLAEGGVTLQEYSFDSPSNQVLHAHLSRGTVQVLADRGQWFVVLAPPGADEFFDSSTWHSCLTGTDVSLTLQPLAAQVEWLIDYLTAGPRVDVSTQC